MLKKRYRLKKNSAFTATYRLRNSVADEFMIVYRGKEKTDEKIPTRAGFVVSKKIHKRAVKRNRIKRLMREAYRLGMKKNELDFADKYLSFIFIAKSNALEADFQAIQNSVHKLCEKLSSR